jgi:UrcA family protein
MNKAFLTASVLGLLSSGIAASAMAGDVVTSENQVAVKFGDLDLQSASGKQALKYRLVDAARSVCPDDSARDLDTRIAGKRCVRRAVSEATVAVTERQVANAAAVKADRG